jgi:hypothetical protein
MSGDGLLAIGYWQWAIGKCVKQAERETLKQAEGMKQAFPGY